MSEAAAVHLAWGPREPARPHARGRRVTPQMKAYATTQVFALGRAVRSVAAEMKVPYTTLRNALVSPKYGNPDRPDRHFNAKHPNELVELVAWIYALPPAERPQRKWIAHVLRISPWLVSQYSRGTRRPKPLGRLRFTPDAEVEEMKRERAAGVPVREIARRHNLSRNGAGNILGGFRRKGVRRCS